VIWLLDTPKNRLFAGKNAIKSIFWVGAVILFLLSLLFAVWSIQAAWLTAFAHDKNVIHELSVRFYIRGGIAIFLFIGAIIVGIKGERERYDRKVKEGYRKDSCVNE